MKAEQYMDMEFNPFVVPEKVWIWDFYPKIGMRKEFYRIPTHLFSQAKEESPGLTDLNDLVKFVILFCDKKSPFYGEKDYQERVDVCLEEIGIMRIRPLARMILERHWWMNYVIAAYFRLRSNDKFESWFSLKMAAYDARMFLRKNMDGQKDPGDMIESKLKAANSLIGLDAKIASFELALFPSAELAEIVAEGVTTEEIGGYAEEFAENFEYGADQKTPPVHFQ